VKDLSNSEIHKIRKITKKAGLEVVSIASPLFKCDILNKADVKEHFTFLPRLIEISKFFDAKVLRGFAFWKNKTSNYLNLIIDYLSEAAEICEAEGVILGLENEHDTFVKTGEEAENIFKLTHSKSLLSVWDPGNAFCAGEIPYPNGYFHVRDYMIHMHIKDVKFMKKTGEFKYVSVGNGNINYFNHLKALIDDKYDGCLSIETHFQIQGNGEKSTRKTFAKINEIIRNLNV
jgi:sugar phosphate isomerase/epimerase